MIIARDRCIPDSSIAYKLWDRREKIEASAKQEITKKTSRLKDIVNCHVLMAPEIEFATDEFYAGESIKRVLRVKKGDLEDFPSHECALANDESNAHVLEVRPAVKSKANLVRPEDFASFVASLKNNLFRMARAVGIKISFLKKYKDDTKSPNMHINFSLWNKGKNLMCFKEDLLYLTVTIINQMLKDLVAATYIFASSPYSYERLANSKNTAPEEYSWFVCGDGDSVGSMSAYLRTERLNRAELRLADLTGLDDLKALFIVGSITQTIDDLIKKYSDELEGVNAKDMVAELESCLEADAAEDADFARLCQDGSTLRDEYKLPKSVEGAFRTFKKKANEKRLRQIFGDSVYEAIAV